MLTMELSIMSLEIPNDAYKKLGQDLIGCPTLSQQHFNLIGWYWEILRRQLDILMPLYNPLTINMRGMMVL